MSEATALDGGIVDNVTEVACLEALLAEAKSAMDELRGQLRNKSEQLARLDAIHQLLLADLEDIRANALESARFHRAGAQRGGIGVNRSFHAGADGVAVRLFDLLDRALIRAKRRMAGAPERVSDVR